jgi:nitrate reductase gamma subunit
MDSIFSKGKKMDFYELSRGPLVWIAFFVFFAGCVYQFVFILAMGHRQKLLYPSSSIKGSLQSWCFGILPFSSSYMRKNPVLTVVTAVFHACLLVAPLFLIAHGVLLYESWQIRWWSIPEILSDGMTVAVVLSCFFFIGRRLAVPEVRNATRAGDVTLLVMILVSFLTGFLATHQWGPYRPLLITHIVSGEILLASIPFTRLSHMMFFWVSRAYMGAEYSKALGARDW